MVLSFVQQVTVCNIRPSNEVLILRILKVKKISSISVAEIFEIEHNANSELVTKEIYICCVFSCVATHWIDCCVLEVWFRYSTTITVAAQWRQQEKQQWLLTRNITITTSNSTSSNNHCSSTTPFSVSFMIGDILKPQTDNNNKATTDFVGNNIKQHAVASDIDEEGERIKCYGSSSENDNSLLFNGVSRVHDTSALESDPDGDLDPDCDPDDDDEEDDLDVENVEEDTCMADLETSERLNENVRIFDVKFFRWFS